MVAAKVRVGDPIVDFTLSGVETADGPIGQYSSVDLRGRPAVLAFYPADRSPVCTAQLSNYAEDLDDLRSTSATVWAISPQSVDDHRAWLAHREPFGFPLLADDDKAVGRQFGILGMLELYRRSTFVVDADGIIRWVHRSLGGALTYPAADELVAALADL